MAGRFCGHSDPDLNECGRQQLAGIVSRISEHAIGQVYTSDLRRAQQTAEAIAKHAGAALHVHRGLREINFGLWEGLSWNEIETRNPIEAARWVQEYPNSTAAGGESFQQFESRVRSEVAFLLREAMKSPIAVVTHAGFIRVVLTNRCGLSAQQAWDQTRGYGSVVEIDTNHIDTEIQDCNSERPAVDGIHQGVQT
jgi:alpha-ribazole phosphatase